MTTEPTRVDDPDVPAPDDPDRPPATDTDPPWRRLAAGMLLVEPVREVIKFIPMLIVLIFAGSVGGSGPPWGLIATAAVIVLGISRYATTRYRITPAVVEVRRGVFQRKHLTVPRDRIRTVDVSAHPLQRLLKLVKVQIGTGTSHHGAEELALDGLPAAVVGPLRAELLHTRPRPPVTADRERIPDGAQPAGPVAATIEEAGEETVLARLHPRWIGYAPATLSGVITGAVLISLAWRVAGETRIRPSEIGVVADLLRALRSSPLWLDALLVAATAVVAVSVLSVVGYVLAFWGYALTRHARGTLQVTRGLLTTRATSIEERRLRGVDRSEPLLLRWFGGARLNAIATGLRQRGNEGGSAVLVPPAPRSTVTAVEADVLGTSEIGKAPLVEHGPAARRRRYTRALGSTVVIVAALFVLATRVDWVRFPAWLSLAALPLAALVARDRYRGLGHAVVADHLVTQSGSLSRHRAVLAVPGVIGVTLRQSFFQRRSGLMTLTATTSAGAQRYVVPDLPTDRAVQLAVRLVPQSDACLHPSPAVGR